MTETPSDLGNWSVGEAKKVAEALLRDAGLREPGMTLIRFYHNGIFRLPGSGLTLRVYGPDNDLARARLMVAAARFLQRQEFPAVRPAEDFPDQPLEVLGRQVSVWRWIDGDPGVRKRPSSFGKLLRRLHRTVMRPALEADSYDPLAKIRRRLSTLRDAAKLPAGYDDVLDAAVERVASLSKKLAISERDEVLLHGDALIGKALQSAGELFLIDLDSIGYGAREWDLAPTKVTVDRFGRPAEDWREFVAGYGDADVSNERIEAAGVVKQLSMTVSLCFNSGLNTAVDTELDRRIRCWAEGDMESPWTSPTLLPGG